MSNKRFKRVKGVVGSDWLKKYGEGHSANLMLEAMANPDLLSDESGMFEERDYDGDVDRAEFAKKVSQAFELLTDRQKEIIDTLLIHGTQENAAKVLSISRSTLANSLLQIQKKIRKIIDNLPNEEQ